jgi:RNA polymerase-binding transcription factor DksA
MSKKTKSKSKPVKKGKTKSISSSKKSANKKAPAKKTKKVKPAAKKSSVKKKVTKAKPAAKKINTKKTKPVAKKTEKKKNIPLTKIKSSAKEPVKSKPAKSIIPETKKPYIEKPVQGSSKPATKNPDTSPGSLSQNRPSVARPIPVNRRPEPARAIINSNKEKPEPGKNRYSDKELEEFRDIINSKLDDARRELANLQAQMTAANDHGTDDTASTFKILEDGSDSLAKEEAGQLASRQKKFIEQLENALVRIENKTYGICRVTGKLIPKERLRAVPHTTQSIEAKLNQYRD